MAMPMRDPSTHSFSLRVYYEDTDAAGIVYHARYLAFAERARTEWLRDLGFDHTRLRAEYDAAFAVRSAALDFKRPAVLDDWLEVRTRVAGMGGASFAVQQMIWRDDTLLVGLDIGVVMVNGKLRPTRIPQPVRKLFAGMDLSEP